MADAPERGLSFRNPSAPAGNLRYQKSVPSFFVSSRGGVNPPTRRKLLVQFCQQASALGMSPYLRTLIGGQSPLVGLPVTTLFSAGTRSKLMGVDMAIAMDGVVFAVPEPGTLIMFGTGILGVAGGIRRKVL